jgi:hypothetical protein
MVDNNRSKQQGAPHEAKQVDIPPSQSERKRLDQRLEDNLQDPQLHWS